MARMVTNSDELCFLEIGIPTYNRCRQLERLLTILEKEVQLIPNDVSIRITISDNYSSDNTQAMLQQHPFRESILGRINKENVGALRNIWGLYESCRAQYVWIISDDDIPKPGSVKKIVDVLINCQPIVLTFEFEQPLGSLDKRHGEKEGIEQITDMCKAIPHILVLGKLTKYITKAKDLQTVLINIGNLKDTGYGWQAVILEALKVSPCRNIAIIHEFLVSCDENFTKLTDGLTPQYWDDQLLLLNHEMVRSYCANYAERLRRGHPKYMVIMIYGVIAGLIETRNVPIFREYGKRLPFDLTYFRNPPVVLEWISLRLGIPAFPVMCVIAEYTGKIMSKLKGIVKRNA